MRNVTNADLTLFLRDLYADGGDLLRTSETGKLYDKRIRAKKDLLETLPEAQGIRSPMAEELSAEDAVHDGLGNAIYSLTEAILVHPLVSTETRQAAAMGREGFITNPGELRRSYADEAATALANRPKLNKHKAALKAVQVPGGGSLFDWVKRFLDSGDAIDGLLRQRATQLATAENASASGALRAATVGILTRFRESLRDEMADSGSSLPADYDARLFAYLDKLSADRTAAVARRGYAPDGTNSTPTGDGAGPDKEAPQPAGDGANRPEGGTGPVVG
ncbi:MAG: hypothetical protein IPK82_29440 [Polyangiaceae bacterium]|nr:hypothetical protein [Polyangiaceae bacterium]